jgi:glycerol-3-phosphate dehydrogenase (NAD(P)+)
MEQKSHVAIIGAGELGAAIGGLLQRHGIEPVLWDADPAKVPGQKLLGDAVKDADCVLFCVPSWVMRNAVSAVLATGALRADAVVISFAKGIEADVDVNANTKDTQNVSGAASGNGKTMTELFDELFSGDQARPFAVVGGPMLAEEIVAGKGAVAVFASKQPSALDMCRTLFISSDVLSNNAVAGSVENKLADEGRAALNIRTEFLNDPSSLSLASVLKNIYAVALGVADGFGASENEKGWVASVAIKEMVNIATLLKADAQIILGAGGAGDLIATGYSGYSRNRGIGAEIARTGVCHLQGEGIASLPSLKIRIDAANTGGMKTSTSTLTPTSTATSAPLSQFPLFDFIYAIGVECKPARPAFDAFFKGDA